jgi:hypothetical protein
MADEKNCDTQLSTMSAKLKARQDAIAKRKMQIVEHEKKLKTRKARLADDYRRLKSMERRNLAQQAERAGRSSVGQHYCIGKVFELLVLKGLMSADVVVGLLKNRFMSDVDLRRATSGLIEMMTTGPTNDDRTAQRVMLGLAIEHAVLHGVLEGEPIAKLATELLDGDDLRRALAGIDRVSATFRESR